MERVWWNQVTNAVKYVNDIKQYLLDEKSVLIKGTSRMPWRDQFVESVQDAVKSQNADKKFVMLQNVSNPGEYILNELCKKEKRAEYRPSKGYARFFAESDDIVLHDRYLWVIADSVAMLNNWMEFVSQYKQERCKKDNSAVFVLEWYGNENLSVKKGIKPFDIDDYIGEYDRIVFSVLASSGIRDVPFIKQYTAELVADVIGNDMEMAAQCVQHYEQFLGDPVSFVDKLVSEDRRSDGESFVYGKTSEEVEHLIWLAQIKTVYPFLEEYREEFVEKHESQIRKRLPIQSSCGDVCDDPKDVELGMLTFMVGEGHLALSTSEYERLKRFRDARNKLSHLTALGLNEIKALL